MAHPIPTLDEDIFSADSVRHARAVDDRGRGTTLHRCGQKFF
jgi:hypothetical protein